MTIALRNPVRHRAERQGAEESDAEEIVARRLAGLQRPAARREAAGDYAASEEGGGRAVGAYTRPYMVSPVPGPWLALRRNGSRWDWRYLLAGGGAAVFLLLLALGLLHHGALGAAALGRPAPQQSDAVQAGTSPQSDPAQAATSAAPEEAPPPNSRHLTPAQAAQGVLTTLQDNAAAAPSAAGTVVQANAAGGDAAAAKAAAPLTAGGTNAQPSDGTAGGANAAQATTAAPAVPAGPAPADGWVRAGAPPAAANASQLSAAAPAAPSPAPPPNPAVARAPASVIMWPVVAPITSFFGPSHPLGIDIGASSGTPIRAAASGRIAYVGGDPCCSYGYHVDIDHGNGVMTRYGHMLYLPALQVGQSVHIGDIIGLVGSTGFSTGPHLHFEVRLNDAVVDPLLVLPRAP